MNTAFGNMKGDPNNIDWEKLRKQKQLIDEEYQELQDALDTEDTTALRDAMCDVLVTVLGLYHYTGHDADVDMDEVGSSNFSKLCTSLDEVYETIEKYQDLGIDVHSEGDLPAICIKSSCDQFDITGKFYPKGKFLKNVNWREPRFE
jgi:hypothetical protein